MKFPPVNEQMDVIRRNTSEIIPEEDLQRKIERSIATGNPMLIKLGCDPSRPDLHLGHAVVLSKLHDFQTLGHQAVLIVGDFTGMIGDPTGKKESRPALSIEETRRNGESYFEQASHILDPDQISIKYNSEWLSPLNFEDIIKLASKYTIARMLERDDFEKRYKSQTPISIHEFLYPLAQAYDSVAVRADVELGGTDQKFNLLVGREIQREYGVEPQVILTMPLLVGTDGVEKMSKSLGNYIAFNDTPEDMYGKTLSIPDSLIITYFKLGTLRPEGEISKFEMQLQEGTVNPRDIKRDLAREIVARFYSVEEAAKAEEHFDRLFVSHIEPENMEVRYLERGTKCSVLDIMVEAGLVQSRSQGTQLMSQQAVSINGNKIDDRFAIFPEADECILKVGKRRFLKVIFK
jgi:tyrosyl-tRNA synthetase